MRTIIDGKADLRPYDSNDVGATPLIFAQVYLTTSFTQAANVTVTNELTATDWGAGLDYYFIGFRIHRTNQMDLPGNEGLLLKFNVKETGEVLYIHTFQKDEDQRFTWVAGQGHPQHSVRLRIIRRVLSTETIEITLENHSNQSLAGNGAWGFSILGSAVTP